MMLAGLLSNPELGLLMFALLLALMTLGFPIAFSLLALGLGFGYLAMGDAVLPFLAGRTYSVMVNDVLPSIPLFLFMGNVIERTNILDRLFHSIWLAMQRLPGSLAIAAIFTCAIFATATGTVGAVVTVMGLIAFPAMLRAGYNTRLAAGVLCACGCLGILIPPSVMLIVYGAIAGVSVVKLYAAAFMPGLLLAGMYVVYVVARTLRDPQVAPRLPRLQQHAPFGAVLGRVLLNVLPLLTLVILMLAAILKGAATLVTAAAVGAAGALVLAFAYRLIGANSFDFKAVKECVFLTARTTAMICWLFVGGVMFSAVFNFLGGQSAFEALLLSLPINSFTFLIIAQIIIFVLGWPLEWVEIIVIFVPLFLPLLETFRIDPLLFGVLVALNLQTSFLSPPAAIAAAQLKAVAPRHVRLAEIYSGVTPFVWIVIIAMAALFFVPDIALWLPRRLYG